jgi:predicted CoA-substrate-specific enzyme activase
VTAITVSAYLGIDVGSVTTKFAILDDKMTLIARLYARTEGRPIDAIQRGLTEIARQLPADVEVKSVGTTGSARQLGGVVVGADVVKNEITAHAVATAYYVPDVRTIIEIGGQDSKLIFLQDGLVYDFSMNTICAAGTGSFLDQQAYRLNLPVEEVGPLALQSDAPVRIAGRCTVFAESDMIHKQQIGHSLPDILAGLCQALARNFLNNLCLGKDLCSKIAFQGGVAANAGMVRAFERELGMSITVPPNYDVMGAIGAAMLAREYATRNGGQTCFKGFESSQFTYTTLTFECKGCSNHCEIVGIKVNDETVARWGSRCGKWDVV